MDVIKKKGGHRVLSTRTCVPNMIYLYTISFHTDKSRYLEKLSENDPHKHCMEWPIRPNSVENGCRHSKYAKAWQSLTVVT